MEKYLHQLSNWRKKITEYINWYNNKRIKEEKLNGLSPIEYRQQAA